MANQYSSITNHLQYKKVDGKNIFNTNNRKMYKMFKMQKQGKGNLCLHSNKKSYLEKSNLRGAGYEIPPRGQRCNILYNFKRTTSHPN